MKTLDSLLDPCDDATFHDSELLSCGFDFARKTAVFKFDIQCLTTAAEEHCSSRRGTLAFSGLCFYWIEPALCCTRKNGDSSLWITAEGPLPDERLKMSAQVPTDLPADVFVHYLYSSSTNSFIIIGAKCVVFNWDTPTTE